MATHMDVMGYGNLQLLLNSSLKSRMALSREHAYLAMFKKLLDLSLFKSLICLIAHCWVSILQMAPWTRSSPKVNRSRPVVNRLFTFDQAIPKGKPESESTPVFVSVQNSLCNTSYRITLYMFIFSTRLWILLLYLKISVQERTQLHLLGILRLHQPETHLQNKVSWKWGQ